MAWVKNTVSHVHLYTKPMVIGHYQNNSRVILCFRGKDTHIRTKSSELAL